jgi:hypothetical protein
MRYVPMLSTDESGDGLPIFLAVDTKLQYPVDFTFRGHRIQFRAGLTVYNYSTTPVPATLVPATFSRTMHHRTTAHLYNSIGRLFRINGDFNF